MKQLVYLCKACGAQQNNNLKTCEDCGGGVFLHKYISTGSRRKPLLLSVSLLLGIAAVAAYFLLDGSKFFVYESQQFIYRLGVVETNVFNFLPKFMVL